MQAYMGLCVFKRRLRHASAYPRALYVPGLSLKGTPALSWPLTRTQLPKSNDNLDYSLTCKMAEDEDDCY